MATRFFNAFARMDALLTTGRARSVIELAIVLTLVELLLWKDVGAFYRAAAGIVITIIVLASTLRLGAGAWTSRQPVWGLGTAWLVAFLLAFGLGVVPSLLAAELLYTDGESWRLGRIQDIAEPMRFASKAFVVILQQMVVCFFLFPSLFRILGNRKVAFAATVAIFSALHLPSLFVAALAAAFAAVSMFFFSRSRRLLPVTVFHILLAILAAVIFPERLTYNFAVGRNAMPILKNYALLSEEPLSSRYDEWKSDDYYEKNGSSDRAFIAALYRDVLGRGASEAEIEAFLHRLHRSNRAEVVMRFMISKEYLELRCSADLSCNGSS